MQARITLRPDEMELVRDLIDYHERSELAGRQDDEFTVVYIGNDAQLTHPAVAGHRDVRTRTIRKFAQEGLVDVLSATDAAIVFLLAEDVRERIKSLEGARNTGPAIFISVAETQKESLARPLRDLLATHGIRGIIVSDEPLTESTWTPEEKVDAYLDQSDAVIVLATADLDLGRDKYTRPNIADEIARARGKSKLRDRVHVLKEHGVTLQSNINPAYDTLDPHDPGPAFDRALNQLKSWGFPVDLTRPRPAIEVQRPGVSGAGAAPMDVEELIKRGFALLSQMPSPNEPSLGLALVAGPRQTVLRPAHMEDPELARDLQRELLFGTNAILDPAQGTTAGPVDDSMLVGQARGSFRLWPDGSMAIVRSVHGARSSAVFRAIVDEDVRVLMEECLRFAVAALDRVDRAQRLAFLAPFATLMGAEFGAWRTRAEDVANPNSMTMNIKGGAPTTVQLDPPMRQRAQWLRDASEMAADLTILLRRAATGA